MKRKSVPPGKLAKTQSSNHSYSRRKFLVAGSAAATALMVVPRHILGGPGFVAPSEKITLAYIGCGTQGLREMLPLLVMPEFQIVSVCDPVRDGRDYLDWSKDGLRSEIAKALEQPSWRSDKAWIPGGREVARDIIRISYAKQHRAATPRGCTAYKDFRELLAQEPDVHAVKIMTPDHLHATVAVAAMEKGKHVMMHKPLANRLLEARLVVEKARTSGVATHFSPASDGASIRRIKDWIDRGAIGSLREIHNWSNRPVWPQYAKLPADRPAVPEDFDWQLWLGPSVDRPYHPNFTNTVFRGWYEFGGGAIADMGHYSLWPVFQLFELDSPVTVESCPTHVCAMDGHVPHKVTNDYSFPSSCTIRFHFAANQKRQPLDLFWYDGSLKPPTPPELQDSELEAEGLMFVGEKGRIVAGFLGDAPRLLSGNQPPSDSADGPSADHKDTARKDAASLWAAACKGGPKTYGDFLLAGPISDAFNLAAVSLRLGGKRLAFDATKAKVTNLAKANEYLTRQYRKGWELPVPA